MRVATSALYAREAPKRNWLPARSRSTPAASCVRSSSRRSSSAVATWGEAMPEVSRASSASAASARGMIALACG